MILYQLHSLGYVSANNRLQMSDLVEIQLKWRSWIIFLGTFVGATVGAILYDSFFQKWDKQESNKKSRNPDIA